MSKWICTFNDGWLTEFKAWLEKGSKLKAAYCKLCHHLFYVSNKGRNAVASHTKGKKKHGDKESLFQHCFSPQIILNCQIL